MRSVTYNCFEGAVNTFPHLREVLHSLQPDIVNLQEINGWDEKEPNLLNSLAESNGYAGVIFGNSNTKFNLGSLTKNMLAHQEVFTDGFWHSAIHGAVPFGNEELHFWNMHLNPRFENDRMAEVEKILPRINMEGYTLLSGDLNSLARSDPYPATLPAHLAEIGLKKFGENTLRYDVTDMLLRAGLVDIGADCPWQYTVPTPANQDADHAAKLRLDYAFATPRLAELVTGYEVVKNDQTNSASDHYPVMVDFDEP